MRDRGVDVTHILLTHAHIDHITGVAQVKEALDVPVYLHKDDLPLYEHAVQQGQMFGFAVRQPPPVDVFYDLSPIHFGDYEVRVHHTPGHCPGGVCLQIGKKGEAGTHLFVGDTLVRGFDRPHRSARRQPRCPDAVDYRGAVPAWRRVDRAPGARAGYDNRPRTRDESVRDRVSVRENVEAVCLCSSVLIVVAQRHELDAPDADPVA